MISPEGCASILFKDAERAEEAAESLGLTAERNHELGVADRVVEEVFTRNGFDPVVYENLKILLSLRLKELEQLPAEELLERRYRRFRALGNR